MRSEEIFHDRKLPNVAEKCQDDEVPVCELISRWTRSRGQITIQKSSKPFQTGSKVTLVVRIWLNFREIVQIRDLEQSF